MSVSGAVVCVLVAFTVGMVAGVALAGSVVDDLRTMLERLLANPDDEQTRAIIRAALFQQEEQ